MAVYAVLKVTRTMPVGIASNPGFLGGLVTGKLPFPFRTRPKRLLTATILGP